METLKIAKNIWNHALDANKKGNNEGYISQGIHHYYGLLSMYSAAQTAYYSKDSEWMNTTLSMFDRYPFDFDAPDIHFNYNFECYRVGGIGKAWLCLKGYFDEKHREAVREFAEKTLIAPKSDEGILCMPNYENNKRVWIDVLFGVCPYMTFAGLLLNEEKYIDFAVEQSIKMYDLLIDKSNGLLHQARGFMPDPNAISHDHWSRGNGWGCAGLAEVLRYLPKTSKYYDEAVQRFVDHCEALLKYQDHRGVWRQSIAEPFAWQETSGTALILYSFGIGIRCGILDKERFLPALEKGVKGLMKHFVNKDFSIDGCCHGCLCPGDTDERRGSVEAYVVDVRWVHDDGHVFGPMILAMLEAYRNGITDIEM